MLIIRTKRFISRILILFLKLLNLPQPYTYMPSSYTRWLHCSVAGFLTDGNKYCFNYVAKNLVSDNPILEIGSLCGLSTNAITYYLWKNNKINKLITCDKWIINTFTPEGNLGDYYLSYESYRQFLKQTYINNIKMFSSHNLPYTIEEFSDDFFKMWAENKETADIMGRQIKLGGKFSFCYIDGNHDYEYVKRDFENTDKFLESGGLYITR